MERNLKRSPSWADLPPEILLLIAKRLSTPLEVSCFISVCKKWRSSLSIPTTSKPNPNPSILSPFLPLQIPNSHNLPFNNRPHDPLILVASAVFLVHPMDSDPNSKGWLLTVEERNPGKLRLLSPLSKNPLGIELPSNFPDCLSLFKFRVNEIAKSYSLKFASDGKDVCDVDKWGNRARKVVLCSTSSVNDCTAMVLYGDGILVGLKVSTGQWGYVRQSLISPFENLGTYESMVCGVDDKGHVYVVDHTLMKVTNTIVSGENLGFRGNMILNGSCTSKRLKYLNHHVMESGGELYLVVWDYGRLDSTVGFEVFMLNKVQPKWVAVGTFERSVLFVTQQWCFLVEMNYGASFKGKAIVYSSGCFCDSRSRNVFGSLSLFQGYTVDLGFHSLLVDQSDRESQSRSYGRDGVFQSFSTDMADMLWVAPSWFWSDSWNKEDTDGQSNVAPHASEYEDSKSTEFSKLKSEVHISCDLVPILHKVWMKHGNILEGSNVHSKFMISCALESLAKVIIILEGNSGATLTEAQCNDMTCTLRDLKHLSLRVEWLVPFVEKAVALYISKPMIAAVAELDKAISRAHVAKMKFSNELANISEMLKALEQDRVKLLERMPISQPVDLDECLGKGLF